MHKGACLCGAVTFEVAGDLPGPDACHCADDVPRFEAAPRPPQ